jgi:hypothetical protein
MGEWSLRTSAFTVIVSYYVRILFMNKGGKDALEEGTELQENDTLNNAIISCSALFLSYMSVRTAP